MGPEVRHLGIQLGATSQSSKTIHCNGTVQTFPFTTPFRSKRASSRVHLCEKCMDRATNAYFHIPLAHCNCNDIGNLETVFFSNLMYRNGIGKAVMSKIFIAPGRSSVCGLPPATSSPRGHGHVGRSMGRYVQVNVFLPGRLGEEHSRGGWSRGAPKKQEIRWNKIRKMLWII